MADTLPNQAEFPAQLHLPDIEEVLPPSQVKLFYYDHNVENDWCEKSMGCLRLMRTMEGPRRYRLLVFSAGPTLTNESNDMQCSCDLHQGFHLYDFHEIATALTWKCVDYSRGPTSGRIEHYSVEFETEEECTNFRNKLGECIADATNSATDNAAGSGEERENVSETGCVGCCFCDISISTFEPVLSYSEERET